MIGCIGGAAIPADGGDCVSRDTEILPADGISGIIDHDHSLFLVGVFLGPQASTQAPPTSSEVDDEESA